MEPDTCLKDSRYDVCIKRTSLPSDFQNALDVAPGVQENDLTFSIEERNPEGMANALVFWRVGVTGKNSTKCFGFLFRS